MVAVIDEKASTHDDAKAIPQRTTGQSVKQNCDCSQIENEKEEEEDWRKEKIVGSTMDEMRMRNGGDFGTKKDGRTLMS